jgi:hypothetical protein
MRGAGFFFRGGLHFRRRLAAAQQAEMNVLRVCLPMRAKIVIKKSNEHKT